MEGDGRLLYTPPFFAHVYHNDDILCMCQDF